MKEKEFIKAAKAIGDKNRLLILQELAKRDSMTCMEAQELTGLSQPTTSHNVKLLAESGLIDAERDGKCTILSLNKENMKAFTRFFGSVLK
jgi:ArsR family transcriptional regulator, arsenate/arsenite/antimonite-responsive transcriptional repressor